MPEMDELAHTLGERVGGAVEAAKDVVGRASGTETLSLSEVAWTARWRTIVTNATYNHNFGLETAYRQADGAWGYPIEQDEIRVTYNGRLVQGRNFTEAGLVVWLPESGATVVGRPQ